MNPGRQRCESIEGLVVEHLAWLEAMGYAAATVRIRRGELTRLAAWLQSCCVTLPSHVTLPMLERYRIHLYGLRKRDGTPLGWGAHTQKLLAVRGYFRWLRLTRRTESNCAAELTLPRRRHQLPRAILSAREVESVLSQPDLACPLGVRDRAILEVLYSTGIRRAECAGLGVADVDFGRLVVFVRQGKGGRDRVVPLGERAAGWIEQYLRDIRPQHAQEPDSRALFLNRRGGAIRPKRLSELVRRHVDGAMLGKTGACHLFRHTMATLMLEGGADVRALQEILGHAQLSTTAIYTHISIGRLQEVHRRTHPAFGAWPDTDQAGG